MGQNGLRHLKQYHDIRLLANRLELAVAGRREAVDADSDLVMAGTAEK
jgi:hypothetical protein